MTDTDVATKAREVIVAALVTNGWVTMFEQWFRSYNRPDISQVAVDRAVAAYVDLMASDILEALSDEARP